MLKITPNPKFDAAVDVPVPGQKKAEKLTVTFKYMNTTARDAFLKAMNDQPKIDALMGIIEGWQGVDVDFSRDALENLLTNYAGLDTLLFKAFFDEHHKALLGN